MKNRIRSTHLHDNDGKEDSHLFPGKGTIDWRKTMKLLRSCTKDCPLLLELREPPEMERPLEEAKRAADMLNEINTDDQ